MIAAALGVLVGIGAGQGPPVAVDDFESLVPWTAHPADGVTERLALGTGRRGRALALSFEFRGAGYAIARRTLDLTLPDDYAFSFWIKGHAQPNTLEFKLIDSTGENVWWYTEPNRRFEPGWQRIVIRKRQIRFAWGPAGGGQIRKVAALELVITAGTGGGTGTVWFDELTLSAREPPGTAPLSPVASGLALAGHAPGLAVDGDSMSAWRVGSTPAALTIDWGRMVEFGGLSLRWERGRGARRYDVSLSDDGLDWHRVRRVAGGNGGGDELMTPDAEGRYLRLEIGAGEGRSGVGLSELTLLPVEVGASRNAFFESVASRAPAGAFPRYLRGERVPWTVVGLDADPAQGLLDTDGAVDPGPGLFSVEPFLFDDSLLTWADGAETEASLVEGDLPMPRVERRFGDWTLEVTGFAIGAPGRSSIVVRYRVMNRRPHRRPVTLALAIRPFQVNPPWQFLGVAGGVARIDSIRWTGSALVIDGRHAVVPSVRPARVGAAAFDGGEIGEWLPTGRLPPAWRAVDPFGAASAAMMFPLVIGAGDSAEVAVEIPLGRARPAPWPAGRPVARLMAEAAAGWRARLRGGSIDLPGSGAEVSRAIRSTLGWIMVNRAGPALQPGSRAYARSWIRDGALTSAALLRFGHPEVVKAFLEWFAPFQFESGKIPCCVDARGADPTPEHDSHGEFIYLVAEYWRHTGDRALVERLWPRVERAARYLDSLRQTRRTAEYQEPGQRRFFGLLPPSISHEGYSAKPMHSYWDDTFAIRGFKDVVALAHAIGRDDAARRWAVVRDQFQADVLASIDRVMEAHRIDYLPGAADLGDFDATSTTAALEPGGLGSVLPRSAVTATFERAWTEVGRRHQPNATWESYTPYELRLVGALTRLGWKDRAHQLLAWYLADRDPPGWNQWSEVVWHDRRAPRFVGDTPHTWVGSDFLRSAADLVVYERESDSALVIGAGLAGDWLTGPGVVVDDLSTWWGPLSYRARRAGDTVRYTIAAGTRIPPGGLVVMPPGDRFRRGRIDGGPLLPSGPVVVRSLPAVVEFQAGP